MKKTIAALLVLLTVVIVTCVYQKTYEIYDTSPKKVTLIKINSTDKNEGIPSANISVPTPVKPVTITVTQPVFTVEKPVAVGQSKKSVPVKTAKVEKEEQEPTTPSLIDIIFNNNTADTQSPAHKEIVDYIIWALKNREIALKNRDEVEKRIHELAQQAMNERELVLEERNQQQDTLQKRQKQLIEDRDASYKRVIDQQTTNNGEK